MRLATLEVTDYRGFVTGNLELDPRMTILVGENGSGKSSLLDAIFLLLSQYSARLIGARSSAGRLKDTDIRIGADQTKLRLIASESEVGGVRWSLIKQGPRQKLLRPASSDLIGLNEYVRTIASRSGTDNFLNGEVLPVYYDQSRSVLKIPKRRRMEADSSALYAFKESMSSWGIDFPRLTYWFQDRESEELRRQKKKSQYFNVSLDAVRRAITSATGFSGVYFGVDRPKGLMFVKEGVTLHASQLSTGEKVFMALAGDLARRLTAVAPPNSDPLHAKAIVLIDELELHLHPRWQRKIIPWLLQTFPNCQFICTTHSPQVLSDINSEKVRVLKNSGRGVEILNARSTRGRDTNHLLASIFEVGSRNQDASNFLSLVDEAISKGELDQAEALISNSNRIIEGTPPELAILRARLARRRDL